MSNSADKHTTIRVIPFKGTKEEWPVWEEKFLARGRRKGYKDILKGIVNVPKSTDVLDMSSDSGKDAKKARDSNDDAYEGLILSINTDGLSVYMLHTILLTTKINLTLSTSIGCDPSLRC